ncbi:hypothetical protein GUITHDRAFT_114175 [Guillardia theta CCMP2712]|uniref:Uncharacterized protein n=1 Tax=Guillardia theta (strain CCMP2712) TaxID=905079 RepID=L1IUV9_GUITC|nr:hypothetical protein GUITHDRAFT_114175 [Guillardia theta CCMP2712]EKX39679.1 hypothetical protein GUITHDRAFT_114175 [Guillardia theta CCMP2712]|eukprot:XP_005826659.1 hypothetical protein GUITHDRAFT_114175 [Guillardia theta CCMP2712]
MAGEARLEALWRRVQGTGQCGKMLEHKRKQLDAVCAELVLGIRELEGHSGRTVEESNDLVFASSMLEILEERNFKWKRGGGGRDRPGVVRDEEWRCAALEFLVGEYQCLILLEGNRERSRGVVESDEKKEHEGIEKGLKKLRRLLIKFNQPNGSKASTLLKSVRAAALKAIAKTEKGGGEAHLTPSIFEVDEKLVQDHLHTLEEISQELHGECKLRREMLLTRMKATAHCFQLSQAKMDAKVMSRLSEIENFELDSKYYKPEELVKIDVADVVRAFHAVSGSSQSAVKRHLIGRVPDRGGRADEVRNHVVEREVQRANDMMRGGASRAGKTDRMWRTQDRPRDWQEEIKIKLLAGVDVNASGAEEGKIRASQRGTSTREICGEVSAEAEEGRERRA